MLERKAGIWASFPSRRETFAWAIAGAVFAIATMTYFVVEASRSLEVSTMAIEVASP